MVTRQPKSIRLLRRAATNNLGLKILSLLAAILLFSLVRGGEDAQSSVFVDVVPRLPPPSSDKMLVSEVPDKVKLTLRGSRSLLETIRREGLSPVEIDLRNTNRSYYYFEPESFDVPAAVELVRLAPASIPLTWAKRVERRLPVEVQLDGLVGRDLQAEKTEVEPSSVRVVGPDIEVSSLDRVHTEPVEVGGLDPGRHRQRVPLEPPPPHTSFERNTIELVLEIGRRQEHRVLEQVEVETDTPNVQLRPPTVEVTLRGPARAFDGLDVGQVSAFVDAGRVEGTEAAEVELQVELRGIPDGVEGEVSPAAVVAAPVAEPGVGMDQP